METPRAGPGLPRTGTDTDELNIRVTSAPEFPPCLTLKQTEDDAQGPVCAEEGRTLTGMRTPPSKQEVRGRNETMERHKDTKEEGKCLEYMRAEKKETQDKGQRS